MTTTRRSFLQMALGGGSALLLAACTSAPAAPAAVSSADADVQQAYDGFVKQNMPNVPIDVVKAAKAEGKVVYYHGQTGSDQARIDLFKKTFPFVAIEGVALSGGDLVQRFNTEYRAGQTLADVVFFTSLPSAEKAQKEGFILPYTIGPASEIAPSHQIPGNAYAVYSSLLAVAWNADKVKDEDAKVFQTWEGLGDARWAGKKFALNSDVSGGTLQVLYVMQYKLYGTSLWQKLAQNYALYSGSVTIANAVASGEVDIANGGSAESWASLWDKSAPVHWAYPEPVLAVPVVQFIAAKPPHPNAAKLFQEFTFTLPSQNTHVNQGAFSDRKGVTDTRKVKSEPWYRAPDPSKLWSYTSQDIDTAFPEASAKWKEIFKA